MTSNSTEHKLYKKYVKMTSNSTEHKKTAQNIEKQELRLI